jgi:hypothetical protein
MAKLLRALDLQLFVANVLPPPKKINKTVHVQCLNLQQLNLLGFGPKWRSDSGPTSNTPSSTAVLAGITKSWCQWWPTTPCLGQWRWHQYARGPSTQSLDHNLNQTLATTESLSRFRHFVFNSCLWQACLKHQRNTSPHLNLNFVLQFLTNSTLR